MKRRVRNIRARAGGIDAVRGALFGANDNSTIGGARRGGRLGSTSDSA